VYSRNVNTIESESSLKDLTIEEMQAIKKFAEIQERKYLDICEFCYQDPTSIGSYSHKDSIRFAAHYGALVHAIDIEIKGRSNV
jgi:hypothetical protein